MISTEFCLDNCDAGRRRRMRQASVRLIEALEEFAELGRSPMEDLLGDQTFTEWAHYPDGDLFDRPSGVLVFYHAHDQEDRPAVENGHFHCFVDASRARVGARAVRRTSRMLCHVAGLSIDRFGLPCEVFATNQWVTGERLYREAIVADLLPRFAAISPEAPPILRWVGAMVTLFEPQIHDVLRARDRGLGLGQRGARERVADRSIDIVASARIDIGRQLDCIDGL